MCCNAIFKLRTPSVMLKMSIVDRDTPAWYLDDFKQ
jgi:hypothetical protein